MLSLLAVEQRRERLLTTIGMIGSLVAIASFFVLPIGMGGMTGPLAPTNGWTFLLFLLSAFPQVAFAPAFIVGLLIVLLLPGCCLITLGIGGASLFRPVPRRWVNLYTLAMLPGLILLTLMFCANFATFQQFWGFAGMGLGYLGLLGGRIAFAQESASD